MSHYQGSVPDTDRATDWRDRAACRETDRAGKPVHDPELFFPVGTTGPALLQAEEAKAICARCPVISECLQWALETNQEFGVWGGFSEAERRALKRRRARGGGDALPPKKPALPATVQELWDRQAKPITGGHYVWSGPNPGRTTEGAYTPMQAAFIVGRGRKPTGRLKRVCEVRGCIWHVEDLDERTRCSTPAAYHQHRRYGEPIDDACRKANSQADAEHKQRTVEKAQATA